jgi:UTP--glucose-1-phosphate uridylyltransferase
LGHAVSFAESHVGSQPFVVLLGDEFLDEDQPLLPAMLDLQARTGGIVLAFLEVDPSETSRYGIASVEPAPAELAALAEGPGLGEVHRVTGLVERPPPDQAPSNLAVVGRYVLPPTIFEAIRRVKPGAGDEIQLTDAMALLLEEGTPAYGIVYRGTRYDTGLPLGYLQAVVQIAARRPDLGPAFLDWLTNYVRGEARDRPD